MHSSATIQSGCPIASAVGERLLRAETLREASAPATLKSRTILLSLLCMLTGCGYQQSGSYSEASAKSGYRWASLYREDVQTVAVPIFTNRDFRRGVEFRLTKALINQLEANTPYRVAPRERADTILEGEIVTIDIADLSRDVRANVPQEQLYVLTINFTWKDLRSGRILVERRNFQQTAAYFATLGEPEFVGAQDSVEKLALSIVQEMQADW
jgi:hypothetical protein